MLKTFTEEEKKLTLTELHEITKIGKSNLQRLLYTLTNEGLLQKNEEDKKYQLGLDFIFFGELVKKESLLLSTTLPIMKKLNMNTNESISLSIIEDNQRKCISNIESFHELKALTYVGQLSPLYAGASAKVLLAYFNQEELESYFKKTKLNKITDNTKNSKKIIIEELNEIKQKGYAISYGERIIGATSISGPIFDRFSNVIAAITIMVPSVRIDEKSIGFFIDEILDASKKITDKMSM